MALPCTVSAASVAFSRISASVTPSTSSTAASTASVEPLAFLAVSLPYRALYSSSVSSSRRDIPSSDPRSSSWLPKALLRDWPLATATSASSASVSISANSPMSWACGVSGERSRSCPSADRNAVSSASIYPCSVVGSIPCGVTRAITASPRPSPRRPPYLP